MKHCGVEERLAGQTGQQHGAWNKDSRNTNNTIDDGKAVEIGRRSKSREKK